MALPNRKNRPAYLRYLSAKYGSAMIASAYSIAYTVIVGQYLARRGRRCSFLPQKRKK